MIIYSYLGRDSKKSNEGTFVQSGVSSDLERQRRRGRAGQAARQQAAVAVSAGGGGVESLSHFTCYFFKTGFYSWHQLSFGAHEAPIATWQNWKREIKKYCLFLSDCLEPTTANEKTVQKLVCIRVAPEDSVSVLVLGAGHSVTTR